mmetsp:Transcript_19405/g.29806  ORF Transcript_19405/g.29806 Transcript_19405/m.29806 type:complete len:109 (-) Transcript_19405:12-338(-)|eukprot:CAMPEP_0170493376 /NCGR_PEP_ID=MMETSP0208-20121228/13796_1 /TAXON_ID=197538 /ORGANISM="Strombidium inclinatum, Strain S3" /LENGTH=108 /DNA_ID=CAMNT_0010769297 /DNA_START=329 /DNA_END=655 /DNA_ORIENTATION=+
MTVYSVRLFLIIVGGFVLLIVANNENSMIDFLCKRFYGLELEDDATRSEEQEFYDDVGECRMHMRLFGILTYPPLIFFQFHCLRTLYAYRETVENKEFMEIMDEEEDI